MNDTKGEQVYPDEILADKIIGHTELNSKKVSAAKKEKHTPAPRNGKKHLLLLPVMLALAILLLVLAKMVKKRSLQG